MLPQFAVKRPQSLCHECRWQIAGKRITLLFHKNRSWLTKLSRHSALTHLGNEFARNSSGNARPHWSVLAEPLWTDPWPEEWNWYVRPDLHSKTTVNKTETTNNKQTIKNKCAGRFIHITFPHNRRMRGTSCQLQHHHHHHHRHHHHHHHHQQQQQ